MITLRGCAFFMVAALAACGGDDGTGPVSQASAQDGCQRDCQHTAACDATTVVADCTASCVGDVVGVLRDDVFNDIVDCRTALACGASGDACLGECQPTATHDRWHDQCQSAMAACLTATQLASLCSVTPTSGSDVGFLCLVTPSIIDEFIACIPDGVACETAQTCLQNVATAHHLDF